MRHQPHLSFAAISCAAAFLFSACGGTAGAPDDLGPEPTGEQQDALGYTNTPRPERPGAFTPCEDAFHCTEFGGPECGGELYYPVPLGSPCGNIHGAYELVVIVHANNDTNPFCGGSGAGCYSDLGEHLASHGFVVASVERPDDHATFPASLSANLDYIYGHVAGLKDDMALFGHSAGGDLVLQHADLVNQAPHHKNLRSMILFNPRAPTTVLVALNGVTDAFMGIHGVQDTDASTYGATTPAGKASVWRHYDRAGINGTPNTLDLTKDFVFFNSGHFAQTNHGVISYVTAFLQTHLKGNTVYNRFLKNQEAVSGLIGSEIPVSQQHAEPQRLPLANFEGGALIPPLYTNATPGPGIVSQTVGFAYNVDDYSPHVSRVLRIDWANDYAPADTQDNYVRFPFSWPQDLSAQRYLSFRISQIYHPIQQPAGDARDLAVRLCNGVKCRQVTVDPLPFSIPFSSIPTPSIDNLAVDMTKNGMRTYLVRLSDFSKQGLSLTSVDALELHFTSAVTTSRSFVFDDIEFIQ